MDSTYKMILQERIDQYGIETLTDNEALSLLTGIPIAEIKSHLDSYGLPELIKFSDSMNLTKTQKKKLELLYSFAKRLATASYKAKAILNSSSKSGEFFLKELQFHSNEVFVIALLDSQNRLIKTETISRGTINEAPVYPREIVKTVLFNNANSVILAHNHPGGSQQTSNEDIDLTKKVIAALSTINVKVVDHIIVADDKFVSFAEKGILNIC